MKSIAIVGSGIVGSLAAYLLARKGHHVTVFEKGSNYPYPHDSQFRRKVRLQDDSEQFEPGDSIKKIKQNGDYDYDLNEERYMHTGGSAAHWEAITPRMHPNDFATNTLYDLGFDWPLSYRDLQSYYLKAEKLLGVSGSNGKPYQPPREGSFPLPAFPLGADDRALARRLESEGIYLGTTPQARTNGDYEDRSSCRNFGTCEFCPIGARYSPNYHLHKALETGNCELRTNTSVRRVIFDNENRIDGILYQNNNSITEQKFAADTVFLAAGTLANTRLMLLSKSSYHPEGPGNQSGDLGKNLTFHHLWKGQFRYEEELYPGRFGGWTGQVRQFCDPEDRGNYGGMKIEFSSRKSFEPDGQEDWESAEDIVESHRPTLHWRPITFHSETRPSEHKQVSLSTTDSDKFGDPILEIDYELEKFDRRTFNFAKRLFERFRKATAARESKQPRFEKYHSGAHHMGTCRMSEDERNGVVNEFGQVHGVKNLFVGGGAIFPGTSGPVNPTLTMAALTIRTVNYITDN